MIVLEWLNISWWSNIHDCYAVTSHIMVGAVTVLMTVACGFLFHGGGSSHDFSMWHLILRLWLVI